MIRSILSSLALALACLGCRAPAPPSEVLVLGTIHSGHLDNTTYGIDTLQEIVRAVDPDWILTEIPPDRLHVALDEYLTTGEVTEPRVSRFPEYVDAIFPLVGRMRFTLVPCAGWTQRMSDARAAKLLELEDTRPEDYATMRAAREAASTRQEELGLSDDPRGIHTAAYDELVREGMEPYDRLFNDELGPGGWTNINRSHWSLIEAALNARAGEGERFLVTFGAWHKYWFLDRLGERDDVVLLGLEPFLAP